MNQRTDLFRMRALAFAAWLCMLAPLAATAQPTTKPEPSGTVRIGTFELLVEPSAVVTMPVGSLFSIRGSVPCALGFAGRTQLNGAIGLGAALVTRRSPPGGSFGLRDIRLSIGLDDISSTFVAGNDGALDVFDDVNGRYGTAATEFTAAYTLSFLRAAATAGFSFDDRLMLRAGPSMSIPLSGSSRESEAILSPSNMTFLDHTQERVIDEGTGALTHLEPRLGIGAAIGYRLRLGQWLFAEPTVGIDIALTSVQAAWSPLELRAGIAVGYGFVSTPETPPVIASTPPETTAVAVTPQTPRERPFTADVSIDVAAAHLPIELRRQIVARYVPMLPEIFFDRNSSAAPERYRLYAAAGTDDAGGPTSFDENTLPSNAERAHYQTLNVFARRMVAHPRVRLTLTGTTSRDEENRPALALARAQTVADYLADVWGIDRGRITVRSRVDPLVPSNSDNVQGLEENRRVEIEASDEALYRPLQLRSVEPMTEPAEIAFRTSAASPSSIERWEADVTAGGRLLAHLGSDGTPVDTVSWNLTSGDREQILSSGAATYCLRVFDSAGRSVATEPKALPLRLDTTVSVASSPSQPDNSAEFLLVTFDFDRAELSRRGRQELTAILDRIGPDSRVTVTGYTDQVGDSVRNRALALDRARRVASMLPEGTLAEVRGASPGEAPYSGTSPEGRFLSRTVRVVVVKPK